ncbi:hypothetical protein Sste5346_009584 [Sporothrix stenoceras]|uniref:Uncharacterized protein n=1 Tax=Sporothrix stenoceras TaxID=5173 RepID=A0ABR3YJI4_9PEZI
MAANNQNNALANANLQQTAAAFDVLKTTILQVLQAQVDEAMKEQRERLEIKDDAFHNFSHVPSPSENPTCERMFLVVLRNEHARCVLRLADARNQLAAAPTRLDGVASVLSPLPNETIAERDIRVTETLEGFFGKDVVEEAQKIIDDAAAAVALAAGQQ